MEIEIRRLTLDSIRDLDDLKTKNCISANICCWLTVEQNHGNYSLIKEVLLNFWPALIGSSNYYQDVSTVDSVLTKDYSYEFQIKVKDC